MKTDFRSLRCRLTVEGDVSETTLGDFFADNAGDLGGEANWPRRTQIAIDILHRLPVTGGGGAAPAWTLERLP